MFTEVSAERKGEGESFISGSWGVLNRAGSLSVHIAPGEEGGKVTLKSNFDLVVSFFLQKVVFFQKVTLIKHKAFAFPKINF